METSAANGESALTIPLDRLAKFLRQLSHDVRNNLNAVDLQAVLVAELAADSECAEEARRMRPIVAGATATLQQLVGYFASLTPGLVTIGGQEMAEAIVTRVSKRFPEEMKTVRCSQELHQEAVSVDFELIAVAVAEIFKNAFQFREPGAVIAWRSHAADRHVALEWSEPKTIVPASPERWGREPFVSTRRGGWGLGLYHAHRIVAAHGGRIGHEFADGHLTTRMLLPLQDDV